MKLPNWIRKLIGGRPPVRQRRIDRRREELFAELNVTRLETRRVLNGDGLASELVVDAGRDANDGHADAFHLQVDQDQVHVSVNGERVNSVSVDQVDSITIHGSGDDDSLVIDLGDGSLAEQQIRFDGGQGQDSVRIITAGHIESLIHAIDSPGVVDSEIRSAAGGSTFQFEGIEDLSQDLSVDRLTVQLGSDADRVTLDQSDVAGVSQLQVWQSIDPNIDSDSQFTMSFDDPNESLRIVSDIDGETDADHVDVKGLSDSFAASFVFQGDDNDSIVFSGETDWGGGDLSVTAGDVQLSSAVRTDQAEVNIVATEELTLSSTGSIVNHGGSVALSGPSIELDGSINASAGFVSLDAGEHGVAIVRGLIDVSSDETAGQGGVVHVLGFNVGLFDAAHIDASGSAGGGTVLIGGDYLGRGQVRNAYVTYVSQDSIVRADAIDNGHGGKVIVWADHTTRMHGTLSARGGGQGGDGGLIETSGKVSLDVAASAVNASSARGVAGTWLLDPLNVTIIDGSTIAIPTGTFSPSAGNTTIGDTNINTVLNLGTNVSITTDSGDAGDNTENGDVLLNADAEIVLNTGVTVTFAITAAGTIDLQGKITSSTGTLNVDLTANDNSGDQTDPNTAAGDVLVKNTVTTNGGTFTASGVNFDNTGGTITTSDGLVTLNHTGNITIDAAIDAGVGDVGMTTTGGNINGGGTVTAATLTLDASGGIGGGTTFHTDVDTLDLTTGGAGSAGDITLVEADGASLSVATAATAQAVQVTATIGNLTIGAAMGDSNDNITLTASAGDVDGGATVTANALVLSAGGGIGIGTAFSADAVTYSLTTSGADAAGDIHFSDTDTLNTNQITTLATSGTAQTVSLTAVTGHLTVGNAIGNTTDHLTLAATAGNVIGGATATAATLTVNAGLGIGIGTTLHTDSATLDLTSGGAAGAGNITVIEADAVNLAVSTAAMEQTVSVTVSSGDLTVGGAIGDADDNISLIASSGDIVGGAAIVTANTLTLNASGGIGIGTAVEADATSYNLATTGVGSDGDIALVDAGPFNTSQITTLSTAVSVQTVSLTATTGNLTLGTDIGNAIDNLTLVATAGDIVGDVATTATAATLTMNADGGIGVGTAVTADATSYSLTTNGTDAAGDITLIDIGPLNTNQVTALATNGSSEQTVSLTATTGNLTVGGAIGNSADNLTLISAAGNVDGGATATAATLTIDANAGIGINATFNSDADTLNLTSGGNASAGNITIIQADAADLSVTTDASKQTVDVTITTGNLTIDTAVGDANDDINLTASGGDVVGGAMVTADTLTVDASGGIGIGTALVTDANTLDLTTHGIDADGDITVVQADAANVMISTVVSAQTISITLSTGDFTVGGAIGDGADNLTFIASGGDIVGGGTVTADELTLNASGGIGIGTAVTANANVYSLTTSGAGAAGNITLIDTGALHTSQITTLTAAGSTQTIDLTATTGDLIVGGAIGHANDHLNLTALAGDIVGGGATATANTLTLDASGGIGIGTAVQANATSYSLTTAGAGNTGDIALVDTGAFNTNQITLLSTTASAQTVSLTAATGDLTIGADIGNLVDHLTLVATAGDIIGDVATTATAATLTMNAGGGIGIGVGNAVNVDATSYSLTTAGTNFAGDITLIDVGPLNTNQITTLATNGSSEQTVSLTATTGNLTVGGAIGNAADDLTLISAAGNVDGGATATAATLTIDADLGIGINATFNSDADTLNLTSGGNASAGDITIIEADTADLSVTTDASKQVIDVTITTGNLTIDAAVGDANDDINLTTSAGDVVGGATVTADTLTIDASGGIGIGTALDTDVNTLNLTTHGTDAAGDITVVQANAANLMIATDTSGQTISITLSTGDFTVGGAIGDGNDNLTFIASSGDIVGGGTVTANALTLNASGGIGIGTAVTANANTYDLTTNGAGALGNITLVDTGALNTSQITTLTAAGSTQTIDLTATTGDLTVGGAIGHANDHLNLTAVAGDIVGGGATATANILTLDANGGIGIGTAVQANATSYSLTTAGAGNTGDIALVDTGAFNTNQITLLSTAVSAQTVSLTAATGNLTIGADIGNAIDDLTLVASAGDIIGDVATTATAATLTMNAGGGIGIGVGNAVTVDATSYSLTTAGTNAAGNITLVDVGALDTSQITTLATDGPTAQTVSLTATIDDLTVDAAIGDATDHLTLIATAGDVEGGATATAATLTINAAGGIGIVTTFNSDADTLALTSAGVGVAGDITIIEADTANLSVATDASKQTIDVTITTGDLTIDAAVGDANDDINLTTSGGDVVGGALVTADTLTIDASGGIGIGTALDTDVNTLDLTTHGTDAAGDITVVQADAANLMIATDTSGQTISITLTTGDFTVGGAIGDGNDSLTFIASGGDIVGGGTVTADELTLNASGGIGIGTAVTANANTYDLTTNGTGALGDIRLVDTGALNTSQITTLTAAGSTQTIDLTATTGDLTVGGAIGHANDHLNLTAVAGDIVGGGATATANILTLDANGGIGIGTAVQANATSYSLTTAGAGNTGDIALVDTGAFNTNQITLLSTAVSAQTVSLTAATGNLTIGSDIGNAIDDLTLVATTGNIIGDVATTATAATLTMNAGGGIGVGVGNAVTVDATSYSLTTAGTDAAGDITLIDVGPLNTNQITTLATDGSSVQTVSLTAAMGNLTVGDAIGNAADNLTLISSAGNVVGGATVTAETLTVNANGGIGIGPVLETDANTLNLTTFGVDAAGNITVTQADAANLSVTTAASAQTIAVTLSTGDFTLGGTIGDANDSLIFQATTGDIIGGGTVTANDLTLSAGGGIGIGTAVTANAATYSLTTLGADAAGDITLVDTGAVNTDQITTLSTAGTAQTISLTATTGDLTVGAAIGNTIDHLTLIALDGDVVGGATATAATLTVNADDGIGIGVALDTNAAALNLTSGGTAGNGNITVINATALSTSGVTLATHSSPQTIDLTASTGDFTIDGDLGDSNDHLTLRADAGDIVGGAVVTADQLSLIAGGGIGIGIAVSADATSYDLTTTGNGASGNIRLIDTNSLSTSQVTLTTDVLSAQTVELTASTGNLLINQAIGNSIDSLTLNASVGDVVGGALATADQLRLSAGGGIGIGTAVTADANTYHLTSFGDAADGNITLFDNNALNTNQVTLVTDTSAQVVRLDALAGDLTVGGAIGNATDSLTLRTSAGSVNGGATVTAATLTVNSSEGIGTGVVLNTNVDTLDLTSGGSGAAGDIRVQELDATTYVVNTDASGQLIQLTQTTGDITIGGAIGDGADSLTFIATAGNIEGGGTVTANALMLQAGGGIGIGTEITANAASYALTTLGVGAAGNITLVDTNSLTTSQITTLSTGTTPQTISLTASLGDLTVDAAIGDAGDNLILNALVGNVEGGATATAANLTVDAGGGIGIGTQLSTNADSLNLITNGLNGLGDISVVEADAVDLSITTAGSAQTASVQVLNGNLTISNPIGDTNDDLTLITSGGDVVGGGIVTADTLTVNSSGGIGNGIPLQTDANTLDLTSAGIDAAGNISVVQADAANLSIATDTSGQMISVTLTTGDFTVGGAIGDGNDSLMFAASDGNINGGVGTVTANDLTLRAGGGIGITTAVTANAATYNLETQGVGANGNIELISTNSLNTAQVTLTTDASTQTVDLSVASGDLIVGGAIGDSMDHLNLNTTAGDIVGGGATVSAATLTIVSSDGIGVGTALNTDADSLILTTHGADGAGDITVIENDAVDLSINTAASAQTASVTVSNGDLTIGGPIGDSVDDLILITSNGDVVGGGSITADTLTVNSSGGIGIGSILLTNANTILLTSAGVNSAGNITVQDVGSADFMVATDISSQTIDLTTRTGDFNIGGAVGDANDNLRFTATMGNINGGGTVTSNSLTLRAGGGIGVGTPVRANAATYSLTTSAAGVAGNISLVDTGPLNTSQITVLSTDGSSQTVTLTSENSNLTVDSTIGDSNDDLTLIATSGDLVGGGVATADTLRLVAAGGIGIGTALVADATTYELSTTGFGAAGNIALVDQGAFNTSQLASLSTDASTQTISLTASASNLTVDAALTHANDNIELIASGGGVQNTGASVTANALSVDAMTGIGLDTTVTSLEAINRGSGDIQVIESDGITLLTVQQQSSGDVSISAGGTIAVSSGGRIPSSITSGSGSITLEAVGASSDLNVNGWITSGSGQIALRADDDLALDRVARVTTGSNDAVSVTISANDDGAGAGVLTLADSAVVATSKGQISGVLINASNPISGTQVGELLGGTQRNAQIDVTVNDPLGIGFAAEVDWLEGNPGDSDPLRRNPLEQNISTGGVGVNFQHSYDVAPNQGDINVTVALTSIADGSIVLTQHTTDLLDRPEFTTTVTLRVEGALLPFSAPLPEADSVDFVRTFEQIVVTTPATQRIVFVTPPLQFNNSVGSAVVTSQRYYVLRIVSFGAESEGEVKLWDSQPGREEYSLPDLEDPDSGEGFELSQLPELFKRLPDDRYRIYLIEGQTERLVLDFIIRDGQPIESQSDDQPGQPMDATESDADADADAEPPENPPAASVDRPAAGPTAVPAAGSIGRSNLSSVERLGSVPVVSTGGIVLAAGMGRRDTRRDTRRRRVASSQPERDRNHLSARRPASWR
ncbi:hypothetical protein Enr13x_19910 [Stieleria neptunia]|uniref:Uncharacterized protein n=1 Tax=Stieleria neptunia TaxID=2527979 RepID=A0A518HMT3_9BACT|nr:hypothetical protein [Stieleria neptunia]QDV42148.1 hypothetical protein Enr13x_19910 [Stieleria neptunia]